MLNQSLIEDLRARPDSYAACDTAFVTFTKASDARLAKNELNWIRARGLTCRVRMAPDARDLDWNKLVQANFRGDVLRAFLVHAIVWAATIVWIIPMGALVGLVSIDNLSTRIPALARWLNGHAKAKSLFSSLIPTIIVAVVNMLVPTIMIQVSGRGQTFVTFSKLHHATWCRYWKWVVINIGKSTQILRDSFADYSFKLSLSVLEQRFLQACWAFSPAKAFQALQTIL